MSRYYKAKYSDDSNPFWFEVEESGKFSDTVTWYQGYIVDRFGKTISDASLDGPIEIHSTDLYYMKPADLDESGELKVL